MIIYGTGKKVLKGSRKIQASACPNCSANELYITSTVKYFHLFWIPLFPIEKFAHPICRNCNFAKRITDSKVIAKIKSEKKKFKTPLTMYSGVVVIALLISYFMISSVLHNQEVAKNIKNLTKNDVIVFKSTQAKQEYYYCRVIEVRSDTVIYNVSNYSFQGGTPDESTYRKDKGEYLDFFNTEDTLYLTQNEIDSLYENNEIYDLYRSKK